MYCNWAPGLFYLRYISLTTYPRITKFCTKIVQCVYKINVKFQFDWINITVSISFQSLLLDFILSHFDCNWPPSSFYSRSISPTTYPMITKFCTEIVHCVYEVCAKFQLDWIKITASVSFQILLLDTILLHFDCNWPPSLFYSRSISPTAYPMITKFCTQIVQCVYKMCAKFQLDWIKITVSISFQTLLCT